MIFKRSSIALISLVLLASTSGVSAEDLSFRSINLVGNDFSSVEGFMDYVSDNKIGTPEILAECTAYLGAANPIFKKVGVELDVTIASFFYMLGLHTDSANQRKKILDEKSVKYRNFFENHFEDNPSAGDKAGFAARLCVDFEATITKKS